MQRVGRYILATLTMAVACLAFPPTDARALVLHEGSTGAAAHPADATIGRWSYNGSCVAVASDMVLTTRHQGGGIGAEVVFGGNTYEVVELFLHTEADLRLARVVPTSGGGDLDAVDLYTVSLDPKAMDETDYTAVIGGYGKGRGANLYEGDVHYGYAWASGTNTVLRWGENAIDATVPAPSTSNGYASALVGADFDPSGAAGAEAAEAATAEYDSGGGWFVYVTATADPGWYLAGLTRGAQHAVEGESWFRQPSGDPPGDGMDAVRTSHYAAWIDAVRDPHEWITDGDGIWLDDDNWSTTAPDEVERWAVFGNGISEPRTITLDQQVTIGALRIDAGQPYRFTDGAGPAHWLVFESDEDVARIEIDRLNQAGCDGAHRIETTVWLRSPLEVNQRSSGEFTLAGTVTGNGSITKRGGGTLVLAADNAGTLSSEHFVEQGTLCAAHPNALGSGRVWLDGGDLRLRADADALFPNDVEAEADTDLYVEPLTGGSGAVLSIGSFKAVGGLTIRAVGSGGCGLGVDGWTRFFLAAEDVCTLETVDADVRLGPVQVAIGTLRKTGSADLIFAATDADDLDFWDGSRLQVQDGTVRFHADAGADDRRYLTVTAETGAAVAFGAAQHLAGLHVAGGTVTCLGDGGHTLVTGDLVMDEAGGVPDGLLDLTDNNLVVDYDGDGTDAYNNLVAAVKNAWNGGAWDGAGVTCDGDAGTWALGVADNAGDDFATVADLEGEAVDGTSILVRYTFYGNANLDDRVDAADMSQLLGHFGTAEANPDDVMPWFLGNCNYDDRVDAADLSKLLGNWGSVEEAPTGSSPDPLMPDDPVVAVDTAAVDDGAALRVPVGSVLPEPATLLLAAAGALAVLARRGRVGRRSV